MGLISDLLKGGQLGDLQGYGGSQGLMGLLGSQSLGQTQANFTQDTAGTGGIGPAQLPSDFTNQLGLISRMGQEQGANAAAAAAAPAAAAPATSSRQGVYPDWLKRQMQDAKNVNTSAHFGIGRPWWDR